MANRSRKLTAEEQKAVTDSIVNFFQSESPPPEVSIDRNTLHLCGADNNYITADVTLGINWCSWKEHKVRINARLDTRLGRELHIVPSSVTYVLT